MQSLKLVIERPGITYSGLCRQGIKYAKCFMAYEAFQCFTRAIKLNQDRGEAWVNIGILYEIFDQSDQARAAYKEAESIEDTANIGKLMMSRIGQIKKKDLQFLFLLPKSQEKCTEKSSRRDIEGFEELGRPHKKLKLRDEELDEASNVVTDLKAIKARIEKSQFFLLEDVAKFLSQP